MIVENVVVVEMVEMVDQVYLGRLVSVGLFAILFPVDVFPVSYPQDYNLIALNIKDSSIISNPESICPELRFCKTFSIF